MLCNACGGVIGRDCYNPQECEHITQQMDIGYAEDAIRAEMQQQIDDLRAQLAAAEARALPDLPEGWCLHRLSWIGKHGYHAIVVKENGVIDDFGPTPAEAIRNAVAQIDNAALSDEGEG